MDTGDSWSLLLHQESSSKPSLVPGNPAVSKTTPGHFLEMSTSQDLVQRGGLEVDTVLWRVSGFNTMGVPCQLASGTRNWLWHQLFYWVWCMRCHSGSVPSSPGILRCDRLAVAAECFRSSVTLQGTSLSST